MQRRLEEEIRSILNATSFWEEQTTSLINDIPESISDMRRATSLSRWQEIAQQASRQKFLCFFTPITRSPPTQNFYNIIAQVNKVSPDVTLTKLNEWKEGCFLSRHLKNSFRM